MPHETDAEYEVGSIIYDSTLTYPANYKIKIKGSKRFQVDDVFVISRPGALNFYARVIDDTYSTTGIYWCKIDQSVIDHLVSLKTNWYETKNLKMRLKSPITLINGVNETLTGLSVSLYANQYIKVMYGSQEHIVIMDERLNDNQWYGVVANIGNTWKQYNVYVWEQHPSDTVSKIRVKFYETLSFVPEQTTVERYIIDRSPSYMTNIRLFKTTIEEEKQSLELLSYFTKDSDQALVLDNCDGKMRAPYISQQR